MQVLSGALLVLGALNQTLLKLGRGIGLAALALMVFAILLQIFYRYVLNNALPWPEEAARALMIWMAALVAPSAYRHGGFVAIDMLADRLPRRWRFFLVLAILSVSLAAIVILLKESWVHFNAPLLFDSSGLNRLLQDSGLNQLLGTDLQFRTAYVFFAMTVLFTMMILVSVELILRHIGQAVFGEGAFPAPVLPRSMVGS